MRGALGLTLGLGLAVPAFAGDVQVRVSGRLVDVVTHLAPLQDVLASLSQQTGMKVVYDGAPPRMPVTVSLPQRTPVEAVLALFEGLGLNYALNVDRSGIRVDTLIVTSGATSAAPARPAGQALPLNAPYDPRRQAAPEPRPADDEPRDEPEPDESRQAGDQPPNVPPGVFPGGVPGPGSPGSPFSGQIGPLMFPTPAPAGQPPIQPQLPFPQLQPNPGIPGVPFPVPTPTPSPREP